MSKIGKVLLIFLVMLLMAGSICGIYYCIQYNNVDKQVVEDESGMINKVKELQSTIASLTAEKEKLNSQLTSLQIQIEALQSSNQMLEDEKANLQIQMQKLNNRIIYLELLLAEYETEDKNVVTFYLDENVVYDIQLVETNGVINLLDIGTPIKQGYKFLYWTFDGENEVDFSSIEITKDISLYAIWQSLTLFSGEKEIGPSLNLSTSFTLDLQEYFNLTNTNIQVTFDVIVFAPNGEQAWQTDVILKSNEIHNFECEYESSFEVEVKLENNSLIVSPNNYAEGYQFSFVVYEIVEIIN